MATAQDFYAGKGCVQSRLGPALEALGRRHRCSLSRALSHCSVGEAPVVSGGYVGSHVHASTLR